MEGRKQMKQIYGYVRVSSKDQNEDRQMVVMRERKVPEKNIYLDKQSGKDFDRPSYKALLEVLCAEDLLFVKSLDRLGREYADIQEQCRVLTKEKKIDICVIDMPLLDPRQGKDLMGTFLSDLVLQILSFVAENERRMIKQRQAEGIAAAKMRGKKFGRPELPLPDNFQEVYVRWLNKEINGVEAAEELKIPVSTFRYKAKKIRDACYTEVAVCHDREKSVLFCS